MLFLLIADLLVLLHLAFIVFVLVGGAAVRFWRRVAWLHLPAVAWAAYISATGGICPLTPWEQEFRRRAGQTGYHGGFIEHYIVPMIYPEGLTPDAQRVEAVVVIVANLVLYGWVWRRLGRRVGA